MDWLRERNISAAVFEWNTPTGRGEILERIFYAAKGLGNMAMKIPGVKQALNLGKNIAGKVSGGFKAVKGFVGKGVQG